LALLLKDRLADPMFAQLSLRTVLPTWTSRFLAAVIIAIYPGCVIGGVVAYLIAWFIMPARPAASLQPAASS